MSRLLKNSNQVWRFPELRMMCEPSWPGGHPVDAQVMEGAWFIQERYGLGWWDSLIVATAQQSNCRYLLTEDLQESQLFGQLEVVNPFRRAFDSIQNSYSEYFHYRLPP